MKKLNTNHQVVRRLLERYPRGGTWMRMFLMLMIMILSSAFAMAQETYGIKIAGEDITGYNRYDLTEISGVSGTVYFDPNTRTLTLDNATIEANDYNAILNETCDYLLIELIGTNTINVTGAAGINLKEETTIWSNCGGKLSVKSDLSAVLFRGCPLEISNCWLEAEGAWGISAYNNAAEEVLTIRNSHVEAKGSSGSICDIAGLKLDGCFITWPTGAKFDANVHAVTLKGEVVTYKVVIEPHSYGFEIADVDVTSLNCKDLSVIDGVDGKINYNPETNTLTIEDVTINTTKNGIRNKGVKGLKIEVVGNNAITSNEACISISKKSTISGSGTLRLKTSYDCGLFMYKSSLTVEGVKLYTEGRFGVAGVNGKSAETLTLRNAYVEATGSLGSVCYLQDLILDGCSITQPTGAEFDARYHSVLLNGQKVTDKVVIEPDANGISDITTDVPAHKQGIYSMTGVKQTQQWNELPAGIYIVDGVKRVKR
ncbi:peptidase [Prevotella pectinovora]|uniref:peptidase n=1 Tax=Prevotella pectinovora TaxID=1602169 RepID=UPI002FD8E41D